MQIRRHKVGFTTLRLRYAQPRAWAAGHRVNTHGNKAFLNAIMISKPLCTQHFQCKLLLPPRPWAVDE
eukprot:206487-Chlamydomonas_euryale.AAC.1